MAAVAHFTDVEDDHNGIPVSYVTVLQITDAIRVTSQDGVLQVFEMIKGKEISWINGEPPIDEPKCGFHNQHCIRKAACGISIFYTASTFNSTYTYRMHDGHRLKSPP